MPHRDELTDERFAMIADLLPSPFHRMKYRYTIRHGGRSLGIIRHWQPVRVTYGRRW